MRGLVGRLGVIERLGVCDFVRRAGQAKMEEGVCDRQCEKNEQEDGKRGMRANERKAAS